MIWEQLMANRRQLITDYVFSPLEQLLQTLTHSSPKSKETWSQLLAPGQKYKTEGMEFEVTPEEYEFSMLPDLLGKEAPAEYTQQELLDAYRDQRQDMGFTTRSTDNRLTMGRELERQGILKSDAFPMYYEDPVSGQNLGTPLLDRTSVGWKPTNPDPSILDEGLDFSFDPLRAAQKQQGLVKLKSLREATDLPVGLKTQYANSAFSTPGDAIVSEETILQYGPRISKAAKEYNKATDIINKNVGIEPTGGWSKSYLKNLSEIGKLKSTRDAATLLLNTKGVDKRKYAQEPEEQAFTAHTFGEDAKNALSWSRSKQFKMPFSGDFATNRTYRLIDEQQSDLHQKGRKGYRGEYQKGKHPSLKNTRYASGDEIPLLDNFLGDQPGGSVRDELPVNTLGLSKKDGPILMFKSDKDDMDVVMPNILGKSGPPRMPFKKNWEMVQLKTELAKAIEANDSYLLWTPGEVQVQRNKAENDPRRKAGYEFSYDQRQPKEVKKLIKKYGGNPDKDYIANFQPDAPNGGVAFKASETLRNQNPSSSQASLALEQEGEKIIDALQSKPDYEPLLIEVKQALREASSAINDSDDRGYQLALDKFDRAGQGFVRELKTQDKIKSVFEQLPTYDKLPATTRDSLINETSIFELGARLGMDPDSDEMYDFVLDLGSNLHQQIYQDSDSGIVNFEDAADAFSDNKSSRERFEALLELDLPDHFNTPKLKSALGKFLGIEPAQQAYAPQRYHAVKITDKMKEKYFALKKKTGAGFSQYAIPPLFLAPSLLDKENEDGS